MLSPYWRCVLSWRLVLKASRHILRWRRGLSDIGREKGLPGRSSHAFFRVRNGSRCDWCVRESPWASVPRDRCQSGFEAYYVQFLTEYTTLLPTTYRRLQCVWTAYVTGRRIAYPPFMAARFELAMSVIQAPSPFVVKLINSSQARL